MVSDLASALIAQLDDDALAGLATRLTPFLPRPNGSDEDRWLSTRETARYLGITANALHKLTAARAIPIEQEAQDLSLRVAGFGCPEIAEITGGRTYTNVNKHLRKARARIRYAELQGDEGQGPCRRSSSSLRV